MYAFKKLRYSHHDHSGLWRYLIGDTVRFTLSPYRIRVTGRTKHHINVFGEEMVENTDLLFKACK
jgi:non-ribosomal peptide synthetase component E (peptide arylation enzyme)